MSVQIEMCVFITIFWSAIIYFLGLEASEVLKIFAYMLHLQMACDFEAFIAVKTMWF